MIRYLFIKKLLTFPVDIWVDLMSRDRDKYRKVARGSTLFSRKDIQKKRIEKYTTLAKKGKDKSNVKLVKPEEIPKSMIPDPNNADRIIRYLADNDIRVHDYKKNYIVRRIRARVVRSRLGTFKEYYKFLLANPSEINIIKNSLSINVTRFFRNRDTFDYIKQEILPLVAREKEGKNIKLWSAGCAVGAEPYSITFLMDYVNAPYSVQATDIKSELLEMGRGALYDNAYLGELNHLEKTLYFDLLDNNTVRVKKAFRSKVKFYKLNLLKDRYPKKLDVIFCRNVLIYIDKIAQIKIIKGFMDSLNPGGFLILGRTESIFKNKQINNIETFSSKHEAYSKNSLLSIQITDL